MPLPEPGTLRQVLAANTAGTERMLWGAHGSVALAALAQGTAIEDAAALSGGSVVLATRDQLTAAQALVALDGNVRQLVICPPDLPLAHLAAIAATAEAQAIVTDRDAAEFRGRRSAPADCVQSAAAPGQFQFQPGRDRMGFADLRYDRRAEDGRPFTRGFDRRDQTGAAGRPARLGDVL